MFLSSNCKYTTAFPFLLEFAEVSTLRYNVYMNSTGFSKLLMLELLLLLAFILPPLVESLPQLFGGLEGTIQGQNQGEILEKAVNPAVLSVLLQGLFAFAMFLRSNELDLIMGKASEIEKKHPSFIRQFTIQWILPCLLVFGLLLANSLLWNSLAQATGKAPIIGESIQLHSLPLMIFATAVAAFYEEILYRWYGPKFLKLAFSCGKQIFQGKTAYQKKKTSMTLIFVEALLVIIFALSHGYGGWLAVGNAFVAGSILRLCVMYTKKPWVGFFSHLAYNLIQFALLLKS